MQWERANLKDKLLAEKQQIVDAKKRAYIEYVELIHDVCVCTPILDFLSILRRHVCLTTYHQVEETHSEQTR